MGTVYPPSEDSYLLEEALLSAVRSLRSSKTENRRLKTVDTPLSVLDMGTGSGILAIAAAKEGCSVTAVDINPEAIKEAKENAKKAGVKIRFILSDLFENVKGQYDLIVFNPPYVKTEDSETVDLQSIAWAGGKDGMAIIGRFLSSVRGLLKPGGRILLLVSTIDDTAQNFPGFQSAVLKKASFFFERLWALELT